VRGNVLDMLQDKIKEMIEQVRVLTRLHGMWCELFKLPNVHRPAKTIQEHEHFFGTLDHVFRLGFNVTAYQLFERRPNTTSLRTLVEDLKSSDSDRAQKLESLIQAQQKALVKIFTLRCNVDGHRNKGQTPEQTYAKVKLKPSEMQAVLSLAQDVVSSLAEAVGIGDKVTQKRDLCDNEEAIIDDIRQIIGSREAQLY
jgi:hypothetical protein